MDYRSCVRATRSLSEGEDAFFGALERAPGFDAARFASFLADHRLLEWVAPIADDERARSYFPGAWLEQLHARRAEQAARSRKMLADSDEVRRAFAEQGIECLFLKGLYFGERFYGDVHRRYQRDIDVLVRLPELPRALEALWRLDYSETNVDDGKPVARGLHEIQHGDRTRAPHGLTLSRGQDWVDVHWCLSSRSVHRIDEQRLWNARSRFRLAEHVFDTLADDDTLMFVLVSLAMDLKRGACKAKHFLDLYLILRTLGRDLDWEAFLQRRRAEGLAKVSVNVLALLLCLWDCRREFPGLVRVLARKARLLEIETEQEALALATRPRRNRENRVWFRRVYPRTPLRHWAWRLSRDLPHTVGRMARPRESSPLLGAPDDAAEQRR